MQRPQLTLRQLRGFQHEGDEERSAAVARGPAPHPHAGRTAKSTTSPHDEQYCVLPLGSQSVHETQPVHVKSVFLAGPAGTGKKMVVNAVAHELGVCAALDGNNLDCCCRRTYSISRRRIQRASTRRRKGWTALTGSSTRSSRSPSCISRRSSSSTTQAASLPRKCAVLALATASECCRPRTIRTTRRA